MKNKYNYGILNINIYIFFKCFCQSKVAIKQPRCAGDCHCETINMLQCTVSHAPEYYRADEFSLTDGG